MNPSCARCGKIVYPTEKVNCLDKFWHKACFHCDICKMTLNMKNYKGYDKKPYCSAHYPKQSFTTVADTPENLRLKQQSELQSQIRYKEDFEKNKGKGFSVVADTPELQRIKKTQDQISNVKYHEEFDKSRMGNPSIDAGDDRRGSEDSANYRRTPSESMPSHQPPTGPPAYQHQRPQQPPLQTKYGYQEPVAPVATQHPASAGGVTCDNERGCGRGSFCDRHFGLCVALRHEGQYCRKDSQCVRGLGCMYGHCQRIIPGGNEGSRCRQDKDCLPSMCCARHHGEMICKRKLPTGDKCYVPEGGLAFSINELCPCEEGLVCSSTHPPREKEFVYSPSSDWKCLAPSP